MADSTSEPTIGGSSSSGSDEKATEIQPIRMPTIEEIRAQEVWNNCVVRAVTSGVMGGPKAACIGCAGFATFSVLIEKFFDRHT